MDGRRNLGEEPVLVGEDPTLLMGLPPRVRLRSLMASFFSFMISDLGKRPAFSFQRSSGLALASALSSAFCSYAIISACQPSSSASRDALRSIPPIRTIACTAMMLALSFLRRAFCSSVKLSLRRFFQSSYSASCSSLCSVLSSFLSATTPVKLASLGSMRNMPSKRSERVLHHSSRAVAAIMMIGVMMNRCPRPKTPLMSQSITCCWSTVTTNMKR
mmetsp:Transcript_1185/g.2614  ORF Transcript_1185/g.2614 Transcript_1185/m.2614 type:complete len:217 (-) Transcript_1185:428-1078(-)